MFKDLNDEREVITKAVASLATVKRKGGKVGSVLELDEEAENLPPEAKSGQFSTSESRESPAKFFAGPKSRFDISPVVPVEAQRKVLARDPQTTLQTLEVDYRSS
ncbi:hypothetical protein GGX14DRAFT_395582 [Mycena pura]|uniref:Uncharacterized protein n=1 Tax=Mycena pura TaxID=153505 RepID=A0AAD6YCF9_9AGAR|nr:hypothetical protein GGX14DRAFT_395582 [Mycena pura]